MPFRSVITTGSRATPPVARFKRWIDQAKAGDAFCYYYATGGFHEIGHDKLVDRLFEVAAEQSDNQRLMLFQRHVSGWTEYLAVRVSAATIQRLDRIDTATPWPNKVKAAIKRRAKVRRDNEIAREGEVV